MIRRGRKSFNVKKLAAAGLLTAVAVACSPFSIPVGASQCFPVQHMVNVLAAVFLGPWYGVAMAFVTSLIRNMLGTGSLLAFPGSMCGALLCEGQAAEQAAEHVRRPALRPGLRGD